MDEYVVQEIVAKLHRSGQFLHRVRWAGCTPEQDTEEEVSSMEDCAAVADFEATNPVVQYEPEAIVGRSEENGVVLYRVRWAGFGADGDTDVPADEAECFEELIAAYEATL